MSARDKTISLTKHTFFWVLLQK